MNDLNRPTSLAVQAFDGRSGGPGEALRLRKRPAFVLGLMLPVLLVLPGCKDRAQRAAELAQQADVYVQAGNIPAAREAIRNAILLREDEPEYHKLQGTIALRADQPSEAFRAFSRALEFDATDETALAYVANIGVQVGEVPAADAAADRLLTLQPDARPALQVKGMIALARGKYDDALRYGERLLELSPNDEAGSIIKARSLAKSGQAEEALTLLDGAIGGAQPSPALLTNKVNLYRFLRRPEEMASALEQLIGRTGGSTAQRLDQVNLLYKLGRQDQARKAAMPLLVEGARNPEDYRTLQSLWWQYDKTPFPAGSKPSAAQWKDPLAIVSTARFLLMRGDVASAGALLDSAPASAQELAAGLKARLLQASGRREEARRATDAVLEKDESNVDALLLRAILAKADGKLDEALRAAQQAQANDPLNPETYVIVAGIYRAQGQEFRARQIFEEGLKNVPLNFYLLETYTQYLHQLGDTGRAVSAARALARARPSSERAWAILRVQCQRASDRVCAQTALTGFENAKTSYLVDDPPGTPPNRGLFGRI